MLFKAFNMIFRISLIFLICLIWFRYFVDSFWLAFAYTILTTIIIEIGLRYFLKGRKEKEMMKAKDEALAEQIATSFAFDFNGCLNFLFELPNQQEPVQ